MKNKLITLLKATCIMVAFVIFALVMGMISDWSYILHLSILAIAFVAGIYYWYRQMRPKERCYFVSFSHGNGFGCTRLKFKGVFDINQICKHISNTRFAGEVIVVILYYREISEEEFKGNQSCEK